MFLLLIDWHFLSIFQLNMILLFVISAPAQGNFSLEKPPLTTAAPATTPGQKTVHVNLLPSKNRSRIAPQGSKFQVYA